MQESCRYPKGNRKRVQSISKSGVSNINGRDSIAGSKCPIKLGLSLETLAAFGGEPSYADVAKRSLGPG